MNDRLQKILRLALNGAAAEGEWRAAAIRFMAILRADGVEPSAVRIEGQRVPVSGPPDWGSVFTEDLFRAAQRHWNPEPVRPDPPKRPDGAPTHVWITGGRYAGRYLADLSLTELQSMARGTPSAKLASLINAGINWRVRTRNTRTK